MASFIFKCAALLSIATTGINAHPTSTNFDLSTRAASITIPNGDFSAPLQGTWNVTTSGVITASDVKRIKADGNYVVQIEKAATCPKKKIGDAGDAQLYGTISNVAPQQDFTITFQYRSLEDTIYYESFGLAVYNALVTGKRPEDTKKVKANQWYSYTQTYKANHKLSSSDISFYFDTTTCGEENWVPTMQIDNFKVTSP